MPLGVVTPLESHSPRSENGDVATWAWKEEGPFSENGNPNFFSSGGEEWAILGELLTAFHSSHLILHSPLLTASHLILHSPFSEKATKGCHTFLHGEATLLAPLFPQKPFSENPFSDLGEGVTTPIRSYWKLQDLIEDTIFYKYDSIEIWIKNMSKIVMLHLQFMYKVIPLCIFKWKCTPNAHQLKWIGVDGKQISHIDGVWLGTTCDDLSAVKQQVYQINKCLHNYMVLCKIEHSSHTYFEYYLNLLLLDARLRDKRSILNW